MSYGTRIRIQFKQQDTDDLYTILIQQRDYTGDVKDRDGTAAPLAIQQGDGSSDEFPTIYAAVATVRFYCEAPGEFDYLYTSDATEFKIVVQDEAGDTVFEGFKITEEYYEPIHPEPEMEISATDGLGLLSDYDFDGGGRWSFLTIIANILQKTGLQLPINAAVDYRPLNTTSTPLDKQYINADLYQDEDCDTVLRKILPDCRIMQRDGEWYIESYNSLLQDSYNAYTFDYKGGFTGTFKTIQPHIDIDYVSKISVLEGGYERLAPIKKYLITSNFGFRQIITNGYFEDNTWGWTQAGIDLTIKSDDDENYGYLKGSTQNPSDPDDLGYYITQQVNLFRETDASDLFFKIKFEYALMGADGYAAPMYVRFVLDADNGTQYYANYVANGVDEDISLQWTTSPAYHKSIRLGVKLNSAGTGVYYNDIDANPSSELSWKTFDHMIEGVPANGTLRMYFYVAKTSDAEIANSCYKNIEVEWYRQDGEELAESQITTGYNESDYITEEELELLHGEVVDYDNAHLIYQSGITSNSQAYNFVTQWEVDGFSAVFDYEELYAYLLMSRRARPCQVLSAQLQGAVKMTSAAIYEDLRNPGIRLAPAGTTWDVYSNTWDGQWFEILEFDAENIKVSTVLYDEDHGLDKSQFDFNDQTGDFDFNQQINIDFNKI